MPRLGYVQSPEHRARLSAARLGKRHPFRPRGPRSQETRDKIRAALTKHGHSRGLPGQSESPTYSTWRGMIDRCFRVKADRWSDYGGRGITVCERWRESFENFLADMGERPEGTTLDRIGVNGNYEPGNCRWATPAEQRRNRRDVLA